MSGDHVKAIHVLIPQIEYTLRRLLFLLGQPPNKAMRSAKGVLQEKTLTDLLIEPEIRRVLGEDCLWYLSVLLADPRGPNLRNRVCHGLASSSQFARPWSDCIIHVLLVLAMLRPVSTAAGQNAGPTGSEDEVEATKGGSEGGEVSS